MRMTFLEMQQYVQKEIADTSIGLLTQIKNLLNIAQMELVWDVKPVLFRTEARIPTQDDFARQTCTVTHDSQDVVGTGGTEWTSDLARRHFQAQDSQDWYCIEEVTATNAIRLDAKYVGATASLQTYTIAHLNLLLPENFMGVIGGKQQQSPTQLHWMKREEFDKQFPRPSTTGNPRLAYLAGATDYYHYDAGTVNVIQNSPTVTTTNAVWLAFMEGMSFRIADKSRLYKIKKVVSSTEITLTDNYAEVTVTNESYEINSPPLYYFRIHPRPTSSILLYIYYIRRPKYLYADDDMSEFGDWAHIIAEAAAIKASSLANRSEDRKRELVQIFNYSYRLWEKTFDPCESDFVVMGTDKAFRDGSLVTILPESGEWGSVIWR
uniref:Uncharacterized protein n=1 Tax=viral metagenome TaxID=1070528 RepID=A0A6H1ZIP5_9ZZZZ